MLPAAQTYDPLPLLGVVVAVAALAAATAEAMAAAVAELEGRQNVVGLLPLLLLFNAPGEASGEDGALIGCVICIL